MTRTLSITDPQAQLELNGVAGPDVLFDFQFARSWLTLTEDGWWHRTAALHTDVWIRLSGRGDIGPQDALWLVLSQSDRPAMPLQPLIVALFLTQPHDVNTPYDTALFRWIALGIAEVLRGLPETPLRASTNALTPAACDTFVQTMITAIVEERLPQDWPVTDYGCLQVLIALAAYLWTWPPDLVRHMTGITAQVYAGGPFDDDEDREEEGESWIESDPDDATHLTAAALLRNISGLHRWSSGLPKIRGLTIQMPMSSFPVLWNQMLVIVHPDAPPVDDSDVAWLCGGVLGHREDDPFNDFGSLDDRIAALGVSPRARRDHIATLQAEATGGTYSPQGSWTCLISDHLPVLAGLDLHMLWLVATPNGCWIRLIPSAGHWGRVLWWQPALEPPLPLAVVLETGISTNAILALHETFWILWRDLCVVGHPGLLMVDP